MVLFSILCFWKLIFASNKRFKLIDRFKSRDFKIKIPIGYLERFLSIRIVLIAYVFRLFFFARSEGEGKKQCESQS